LVAVSVPASAFDFVPPTFTTFGSNGSTGVLFRDTDDPFIVGSEVGHHKASLLVGADLEIAEISRTRAITLREHHAHARQWFAIAHHATFDRRAFGQVNRLRRLRSESALDLRRKRKRGDTHVERTVRIRDLQCKLPLFIRDRKAIETRDAAVSNALGRTAIGECHAQVIATRLDHCADDRLVLRIDNNPRDQTIRILIAARLQTELGRLRAIEPVHELRLVSVGHREQIELQCVVGRGQTEASLRIDLLLLPAIAIAVRTDRAHPFFRVCGPHVHMRARDRLRLFVLYNSTELRRRRSECHEQ
jgi:hypothetical protein